MALVSPWMTVAQPAFGFTQIIPALQEVSQAATVLAAAPGPYQELAKRLDIYKHKLATQDGTLRSTVKQNLTEAINRLENALLQLYKLAVFIRGNYDEREDDDVQKMAIFNQCSQAFGDCQAASQTGLEQLSNIHIQVTSLQTDDIQQLQRDVQRALDQNKLEVEANRQQREQNQHDVEVWTRQQQEATDALRRAQAEKDDVLRQIGNAFLLIGRALIHDMEGISRQIVEEQARLGNAQEQVRRAHDALIQAMNRQNELDVRRVALEQLSQQLPALQVTTNGLNKDAAALLSGFADLKEKATNLLILINEMKNRATVTMRQAYKKSMFAEGILKLCQTALIDGRVCDEVEAITLEISGGYSGQSVPENVSKLLTQVGEAARETAQKSIAS
ncbi:hypothetical protein CEP54_002580 [Fusarium duplospermum]|uniref:Uncharacterized protein n=1 Tax=Fusarium duplospermum TaxID=1325734 RepID=A0A428QUG3_9HYPO|nr:hypothetical protein CEP54_002580 [Fusarium duplospermum]